MAEDAAVAPWIAAHAPWLDWAAPVAGVLIVLGVARWQSRAATRSSQ
jgi:hypothetical protein